MSRKVPPGYVHFEAWAPLKAGEVTFTITPEQVAPKRRRRRRRGALPPTPSPPEAEAEQ